MTVPDCPASHCAPLPDRVRPKALEADRNWQCRIADPEGHRMELMQMAENSMLMQAVARIRRH